MPAQGKKCNNERSAPSSKMQTRTPNQPFPTRSQKSSTAPTKQNYKYVHLAFSILYHHARLYIQTRDQRFSVLAHNNEHPKQRHYFPNRRGQNLETATTDKPPLLPQAPGAPIRNSWNPWSYLGCRPAATRVPAGTRCAKKRRKIQPREARPEKQYNARSQELPQNRTKKPGNTSTRYFMHKSQNISQPGRHQLVLLYGNQIYLFSGFVCFFLYIF